jgi:CheY-like chemotaxis protein
MARILIIDDDEAVRQATLIMLEARGFDVVAVADGQSGLDAIKTRAFDAVIIDLFMPGMDGIETLSKLLDIDRQLPVVLNTAYASFKDDFMTWAAEAYVVKSGNLDELLEAIASALRKRGITPPGPRVGG